MHSNMFNVVNSVINSKINGVPEFQRLVVMISDTVCIEVSEDSVNVCHIQTCNCFLNKPTCTHRHGQITLNLTIFVVQLLYTLWALLHAIWETKFSTVGFVGTCHISGSNSCRENTSLMKLQLRSNIANCVMIVIFHFVIVTCTLWGSETSPQE